MIEYNAEKYITLAEIARRLGVSPRTCTNNVVPMLTACYLPGRKRPVYKQAEVEQLSQVRVVEKQVQPLILVEQESTVARIEENLYREAL